MVLLLLYINVIITFAVIYMLFDFLNIGPIIDHYDPIGKQLGWFERMTHSIYFSAITLLSVGYGDLTPFGWSRVIAIIEALIGYLLPAGLVIRYMIYRPQEMEKLRNEEW